MAPSLPLIVLVFLLLRTRRIFSPIIIIAWLHIPDKNVARILGSLNGLNLCFNPLISCILGIYLQENNHKCKLSWFKITFYMSIRILLFFMILYNFSGIFARLKSSG